jgi:hypothetical protein
MAKKKASDERDRLAASLAASLPGSGADYQVSAAFSVPERRRFLGHWSVAEHRVDGKPYLESFAATALRNAALIDPSYESIYDFRESLCVKKVRICGLAELPEGRLEYSYGMSVAISWELGPGFLVVRPELGYQLTSLDGQPAAIRELASFGDRIRIRYRFDGELLVLEEGQDVKQLKRLVE